MAELYWVSSPTAGKLAVAARPRAGDWLQDEISSWKSAGVEVVVSLLEDDEIQELDLSLEEVFCSSAGIQYIRFPIKDRGLPTEIRALIRDLADRLSAGNNILVHCRAGIGRTGLLASAVLIQIGEQPDEALRAVGQARGVSVPDTEAQRDWVLGYRA